MVPLEAVEVVEEAVASRRAVRDGESRRCQRDWEECGRANRGKSSERFHVMSFFEGVNNYLLVLPHVVR